MPKGRWPGGIAAPGDYLDKRLFGPVAQEIALQVPEAIREATARLENSTSTPRKLSPISQRLVDCVACIKGWMAEEAAHHSAAAIF